MTIESATEFDARLRREAMAWLTLRTNDGLNPISTKDLLPDSHEQGLASVRNGLALCKIHHAAYDSNILGIRPDLVVQIKSDLLEEVDGPMLQYGLKERHNQRLMVLPKVRGERPGAEFLEWRYESFKSA